MTHAHADKFSSGIAFCASHFDLALRDNLVLGLLTVV